MTEKPKTKQELKEEAEYERRREFQERFDFLTIWSIEKTPVANVFKDVPQKLDGCAMLVYGDYYCYLPREGYTWLDLWKAADNIHRQIGIDDDHRFIEMFTKKKIKTEEGYVAVLEVFMGS